MKALGILLMTLSVVLLTARAEIAPRSIGLEAQKAVQAVGDQMRAGNFELSLQKMYPRWKKRLAARKGGMEALDKQLMQSIEKIKSSGILIQGFTALEPQFVQGVWPGKDIVDGKETFVTKEWLALVPTEVIYRIAMPNGQGVKVVNVKGFQVAIRDKAAMDWTFIDGGDLTIVELRSIFPSLPVDIVFPEKGAR